MHLQPLTPSHRGPGRRPESWTWHDYLEHGALLSAPGCARDHAVNVLREWGLKEFTDVTEVVVSELVSNAVQATQACAWTTRRPPIRLWLHGRSAHDDTGVLVLVWDGAPGCPAPLREAGPDEESGRGLAIVAALSDDWGHYHPLAEGPESGGRGKVVWAHAMTCD
jgi:anti-sigma regulatory factor (Ser/Thr protein kinase)